MLIVSNRCLSFNAFVAVSLARHVLNLYHVGMAKTPDDLSKLRKPMRRSHGFTLIELLVVVAIIIVLIGILLPAIHQVRLRAMRSSCSNNLKQMGLAMHDHHRQYERLPAAFEANGYTSGPGWSSRLLPFLGQEIVANNLIMGSPVWGNAKMVPSTTDSSRTKLTVYRCPGDNAPEFSTLRMNLPVSNYRGVLGTTPSGIYVPNTNYGSLMSQNSKVSFLHVGDGLSQCLLVGEFRHNPKDPAIWNGVTGYYSTEVGTQMWIGDQIYPVTVGSASYPLNTDVLWTSPHVHVNNFLFGDGSVRGISNLGKIDWEIKNRLSLINDGKEVSIPW